MTTGGAGAVQLFNGMAGPNPAYFAVGLGTKSYATIGANFDFVVDPNNTITDLYGLVLGMEQIDGGGANGNGIPDILFYMGPDGKFHEFSALFFLNLK